jgi:hypothetical protein
MRDNGAYVLVVENRIGWISKEVGKEIDGWIGSGKYRREGNWIQTPLSPNVFPTYFFGSGEKHEFVQKKD